MLSLPHDWLSLTSGAVAAHLMKQASDQGLPTDVAKFLISASLDLLNQAYTKKAISTVVVTPIAELEWRLGDFRFVYVPIVNDDALSRCASAANEYGPNIYAIVPPGYGRILLHALGSLLGRFVPTVMGLDEYVSLRGLFASMDFNWPSDRVNIELIEAYNRCVAASHGDSSLFVELPRSPERVERN